MARTNVEFLRRVEIFENVSDPDLEKIGSMVKERRIPENHVLFKEGDPGDALYMVTDGRIKVFTGEGANEHVLAFYGEGQVLGEMALLTGEPRSATAKSETETHLMTLSKADFDGYLGANVVVMREMMRIIALRQVETNQRLARGGTGDGEAVTKVGKVYVVFSPRGGSGKTTIAVNLAVQFAMVHPNQTALLDLCLTFGHCPLVLNLMPKSSLAAISYEALSSMDKESLGYYLIPHVSTLKVMAGANKPEEGETVDGRHVKAIVDLMRRMHQVTVIDVPASFSEASIAALEAADRVVVVCTPDLGTLRDVRECQRIFNDLIHLPKQKIFYAMNHVFPFSALSVEQFEQALEQEMNVDIPWANDLPSKSAVRGEAFAQTNPGAGISKAINQIAQQFEAEADPRKAQAAQRRGFLGRG